MNKPGDCALIRKMKDEENPPKMIGKECTGYVKVVDNTPCVTCANCNYRYVDKKEEAA